MSPPPIPCPPPTTLEGEIPPSILGERFKEQIFLRIKGLSMAAQLKMKMGLTI